MTRIRNDAQQTNLNEALQDLVEEVAYTWFNRIIAIRFMEVNHYLPSGVRVLSSENGRDEPDIMFEALNIEADLGGFTPDQRQFIQVAWDTEKPEDMDRLYAMLFIKQANALHKNLPELFEQTSDYMQLLFTPSYHNGVIKDLITMIPEADFDVSQEGQVEIIGWLYQYYNSEPHDKVVNINGGPIKTHDIPAATQLFTTDWVVRYMVDNSLGRTYLEHFPDSSIKKQLKYLLPGPIEKSNDKFDIHELTVLDDAMGSGHILVYAFDLLVQMYEEQGYSRREAASEILEHNIYGLEIDKRAYQLAYFALMMKAREYSRRILDQPRDLNLYTFENISEINNDMMDQMVDDEISKEDLETLINVFHDAKMLGSIIHFDKQYDTEALKQFVITDSQNLTLDLSGLKQFKDDLGQMLDVVKVLQSKYSVVATNPPYLNRMNVELKKYVKKYYKPYSGDLFSVFVKNNIKLTKHNGYAAYMTPFVWMFIKTYESLRKDILSTSTISSLIQMEYSAFEEATVPINSFVIKNAVSSEPIGTYLKLSAFKGGMAVQDKYVLKAIQDPNVSYLYRTNQTNFAKIPGSPIAYWLSKKMYSLFTTKLKIKDIGDAKKGLDTGNNDKFYRFWYEIELDHTYWKPLDKGGKFRRWYGNQEYVINWADNGFSIKHNGKANIRNEPYYFSPSLTWSDVSSGKFSARFSPQKSIFDATSPSFFGGNLIPILAYFNSNVFQALANVTMPTIHYTNGQVALIPYLPLENKLALVKQLTENCIDISKKDWDSFELSCNFFTHPLMNIVEHNRNWTIEAAFNQWQQEAEDRFNQLKFNEEELNRIFIDLYGLQDELKPEEADKEVSVRKADLPRDIRSFLSYFVGCVFGRYSIDTPSLTYAGGEWQADKYQTFIPNEDDVLLLTDQDYFGDNRDVIHRLKEFLTATFGVEHLNENLNYIAAALNKRGATAEEQIRLYFIDDFYKKDHLTTYQKRPIYWELKSGRNNGFKALMYLHRYSKDTMAMIRTKYLHPLQDAYENKLKQLQVLATNEQQTRQKNQLNKQIQKLSKQLAELIKYDEQIQHVANLHIELDLDDGVIVNHQKAQADTKILSPIK